MTKKTILIIEDEIDIGDVICFHLEREGFIPLFVQSAEAALSILDSKSIDLIILDLMLPGIDGLEFLRRLQRTKNASIPVMITSAKTDVIDIVTGLEVGAIAYLPKPFHPKVLVAKVKSILRQTSRAFESNDEPGHVAVRLPISQLCIDVEKFEVTHNGNKLDLTATEFKILQFLTSREGKVFSRYQIVDGVHGVGHSVTDRSIDVQILSLRRKLGSLSSTIETVRGVGYRFVDS